MFLSSGGGVCRGGLWRVRGIENALIAPSSSRTKGSGLSDRKVGWTQHDTALGARSTDIGATQPPNVDIS